MSLCPSFDDLTYKLHFDMWVYLGQGHVVKVMWSRSRSYEHNMHRGWSTFDCKAMLYCFTYENVKYCGFSAMRLSYILVTYL